MSITAQLVKELRERTGAGMMECKKALQEVGGDIEKAIEHMRKTGLAKADKKAGRVAAEGTLVIASSSKQSATMLEVNCETDFVAMGDEFQGFAKAATDLIEKGGIADVNALNATAIVDGVTVDERRRELVAKIGENITVRRFVRMQSNDGMIGHYAHGKKIAVLVEIVGGDEELAKDIAMHIAASNPKAIDAASLPHDFVEKEKEIHRAKAEQSGKPANVVEKIVDSALKTLFGEVTLLGQKFVKDPKISVEQLLAQHKATVKQYVRYELGEGIEKEETDFVAEVMAQAKGQ